MLTKRHLRRLLFAILCGTLIYLPAFADKISDIHPTSYVTDLAGVIDRPTIDRLNALCAEVEQKTGAQIAVVTVRSLDGRPVEDYAVDLFKHLGVGHKDNRGVLLLLAPQDRHYRFEVGYSLEPVINDARAGDIGREMVPALRRNDYSAAVNLAVNRVAGLIAKDGNVTLNLGQQPAPAAPEEPSVGFPVWGFPLGLFIALMIARGLFGGRRRRRGGWWIGPWMGGWGGGGWGGGSWGGGFGGSSGGFGGFGGGSSGGGGASGSW